jgi:hypothetical protein
MIKEKWQIPVGKCLYKGIEVVKFIWDEAKGEGHQ